MNANSRSTGSSTTPRPGVLWLMLVLGFLLLAWGVWWYFDYQIQRLEYQWQVGPAP